MSTFQTLRKYFYFSIDERLIRLYFYVVFTIEERRRDLRRPRRNQNLTTTIDL